MMDNGDDRRLWNPITPQVHAETVDWMGHECAHDHQGQSQSAHQQAGYRRAVRSTLSMMLTHLAPPGESI
jgi:GTP-dependent phosphoenolpyruvate carboxykinase